MRQPTGRGTDIEAWLRVVGRYALLTAVEERELARSAQAGSSEARDTLATANLRLVIMVAGRFTRRGLDLVDLVAEGHIGLLRAVAKFDPELGCRFSTYAVWWIQQSMRRALQRVRPIRLPAHMQARTAAWRAAARELLRESGRLPLPAEVAARLQLDAALVPGVVDALATTERLHVPIEAPMPDEDGRPEHAIADGALPPWAQAEQGLEREKVTGLLATLDARSRRVLELRFGLAGQRPHTLVEVGRLLDVTRERVRQLEARALASLRQLSDARGARPLVRAGRLAGESRRAG
jgi:RNA polymerase primary sigma factor